MTQKNLSRVTISRTTRNPDGVRLDEKTVDVHNHDIKKCEKIARNIWKEELR